MCPCAVFGVQGIEFPCFFANCPEKRLTNLAKKFILEKSMKIDVRRCNAEKRYSGELNFSMEGDNSLIDIPFVTFASPVAFSLHYDIWEDDCVKVTGSVCFDLSGACSRCLKQTQQHIEWQTEALFVPDTPQDEEYPYRGGVVDLGEFLRDSIIFALPSGLVCPDECSAPEYNEE